MKSVILFLSTAAILSALAGCGGTTVPTTPVPLPVASFLEGPTPISYDPNSSALSLNGAVVTSPRAATILSNGDSVVYLSEGVERYVPAISQNADAFAVNAAALYGDEATGAIYGRRNQTEQVATGTGTYAGSYVASLVYNPSGAANQLTISFLDGDAALSADFASGSLSGAITNRNVYDTSGAPSTLYTSSDITISGGTIATDGTFSAISSGGVLISVGETWTTSDGQVNGVLAGANLGTAAGVLNMSQNQVGSPTPIVERGTFIATRP